MSLQLHQEQANNNAGKSGDNSYTANCTEQNMKRHMQTFAQAIRSYTLSVNVILQYFPVVFYIRILTIQSNYATSAAELLTGV